MAISTYEDLYVNIAKGRKQGLLRTKTSTQEADPLEWVIADDFGVRLHLCEPIGSDLEGFDGAQLNAGEVMILAGRPASDLSGPTLLFSASDFALVTTGQPVSGITVLVPGTGYTSAPAVSITGGGGTGATATATLQDGGVVTVTIIDGGSGYLTAPTIAFTGGAGAGATATATLAGDVQYRYDAELNLTATALRTAVAAAVAAGKDSLLVAIDLEIQNADNTRRKTYQWTVSIFPEVYQGTEGTAATGDPIYPLAGTIAVKSVPGVYVLNSTGLYLYNADQAKYHPITIHGALGAETFRIGDPVATP